MIKNYFLIALRNFWRNKLFSFIHILGLSIGISAALLIFLIVNYEFGFDHFEKDQDRLYRVVLDVKYNGDIGHSPAVPAPLARAVQRDVPAVDLTVPVMQFQGDATAKVSIAPGEYPHAIVYKKQADIVFTNDSYFQMIPFAWIAGSPGKALQNPFSVVLTQSRARQYFPGIGYDAVLGKQIEYNDGIKAMVTGIVEDLDQHTDFTAREFISYSTISKTALQSQFMMDTWNDWMAYSKLYLRLSTGSPAQTAQAQLNSLLKRYNKDANKDEKNTMRFKLQPLRDVHFNTDYAGFGQRTAHKSSLYALLALGAFLLLLACINFINLSTAQSATRAKEIGIRKTVGSSKKQLVIQFLCETFLITAISTILSVILAPLLLKLFADFIPAGMHFNLLQEPALLLFLPLLTGLVSFLSGLYPAVLLSRYNPAFVLKNQAFTGSGQTRTGRIRKTLTVSQFAIAQFFVIASFMVSKQIHYTLNKDLGFKKTAILNFQVPFDTVDIHQVQLLKEINSIPEVNLASVGFLPPATEGAAFADLKYIKGAQEVKINVQIRWGDSNYLKLYQIKLIAGRNVQTMAGTKEFLINETYAKALGFSQPVAAINQELTSSDGKKVRIVGVMQDFHEQSLHGLIGPLVFESSNSNNFFFHIGLAPQDASGQVWPRAISKLSKAFKSQYPSEDFNYSFFDESIAKFYESEQQTSLLLNWATGLAILISCLGLLGLVIYTTLVRTKEIGIRKILGASIAQLISILSKDFLGLVLLGSVIATPIAWWASSKWLENFAYRTPMSWWIFVGSGSVMILAALFTLSMQTIKTAFANPVKNLKTE